MLLLSMPGDERPDIELPPSLAQLHLANPQTRCAGHFQKIAECIPCTRSARALDRGTEARRHEPATGEQRISLLQIHMRQDGFADHGLGETSERITGLRVRELAPSGKPFFLVR